MKIFRFFRAIGGMASDGDRLTAKIAFEGVGGLENTCRLLGLELQASAPVPAGEISKNIRAYPQFNQLCHTQIFGIRTFVWVEENSMKIDIAGADGDPYSVTEKDVENALKLEAILSGLPITFIDPPGPSSHVIHPDNYPDFWE